MGLIPQEFIDELINRSDIIAIIDGYLPAPLKKKGNSYIACCPFHDEKTGSFNVSANKQVFHCFGCGAGGNVITFLMDYNTIEFPEAIDILASHTGLEVPRSHASKHNLKPSDINEQHQLLADVCNYFQQQLRQHPQAKTATTYLKKRGLCTEICQQFQLGFAPPGWDNLLKHFKSTQQQQLLVATGMVIKKDNGSCYDRYRNRIVFPIHDRRGRIVGFGGRVIDNDDEPKYLNSPETTLFHKSQELYGLHQVLQTKRQLPQLLLVEGYMDVVALAQHGINYAVATLGTATTKEHIQQLTRHSEQLIFCFDGDKAGQQAAWYALEVSLGLLTDDLQLRFMFLPHGEDPDSLVHKQGKQAFEHYITAAKSLSDFFFDTLKTKSNGNDINSKSRLIKFAAPLLKKISAPTFSYLMFEQLGKMLHIDTERLKQLVNDTKTTKQITPQQPNKAKHPPPSTMRLAIILLLQNPHLAKLAPPTTKTITGPGSKTLLKLLDLLDKDPHLSTGALVEYWRDSSNFSDMNQLANSQHHVPNSGIDAEFSGIIDGLTRQSFNQKIDNLLETTRSQGFSDNKRQQLQQMILKKKKTDKQNQ